MLKRITTALVAALSLSAPAMAWSEATQLDPAHQVLWETLESKGVWTFVNPEKVCQDPEKDPDGAYFYAPKAGRPILIVCQDNRDATDTSEVAWTANDFDTIRHEAMHFLQDCLDGEIDQELLPFYDGPGGAPGNITAAEVQRRLGYEWATGIALTYASAGADAATIRLEHEAFYVAANISPVTIAHAIDAFCPAK